MTSKQIDMICNQFLSLSKRVEKLEKALAENSAENSAEPYVPQFLDKVLTKGERVGYVTRGIPCKTQHRIRFDMDYAEWFYTKDLTLISRHEQ